MRKRRPGRARAAAVPLALLLALVAAGCGGYDLPDDMATPQGGSTGGPSSTASDPTETAPAQSADPPPADLDLALSEPAEDSYYPEVGDPSVDALHYDLDLTWDPATDTLTGAETLTFRSTGTADRFQLDFGEPLEISSLTLDGAEVSYEHTGKDLVVTAPVKQDQRYELVVDYSGTPEPVRAPTERSDLLYTGFTIDDEHQTWTMQEPIGAYSWYAVNDQPSDKALYDFTLQVPSPWTGVANGLQTADELTGDDDATHKTQFHLAEPAASYLITLAFGDYDKTEDIGPNDLPITYWTPRGDEPGDGLRYSPEAIAWLEEYLGPYPFDTAGILLVDSESGMETQTLITLGDTPYSTSADTVVHEFAHQWYGDQVSPDDWRDVWMNEGMAMYLQLMWQAEQEGTPFEQYLDGLADDERHYREESGPPGAYDPSEFGNSNVYFGGAFFWQALREKVGDEKFFEVVRGWPQAQDNKSTDRETLLAYLEEQTGEDLDDLWNGWVLGESSPTS
ncbi:M1 family metallopeptidase [Nocardioides sp. GXZ039]|uniref:M1 family metallopeptidase n=1 Tax=Nocardioides sp. GXZ039 TaxID=3136018 RepID=UPI0030F4495A